MNIEVQLTNYQNQLVLGTLLGTSSIIKPKKGRSAFLQVRESNSGDVNWFNCKAAELQNLARPHPIGQDKDSWHWISAVNPVWNNYLELCYKDGCKTVTQEWLHPLKDTAWATWFLDDGVEVNKIVCLKTARFGDKGNDLIAAYMTESGFECKVELNRGVRRIVLTEDSAERYMKLILPKFPKYLLDALSNSSCIGRSGL